MMCLCVGVLRCVSITEGELERSNAPQSHLYESNVGVFDMYGLLRSPPPGILYY
jgi:hypothetical protein